MQTIFWNKVESGGQIILPPSGVAVLASVVDANGDSMIVRAIYAATFNQKILQEILRGIRILSIAPAFIPIVWLSLSPCFNGLFFL